MKHQFKRIISLLLCATVAAPLTLASPITAAAKTSADVPSETADAPMETTDTPSTSNEFGLKDNIQDGTILHCFNWQYSDVTDALPRIAKAGFTSVQVMPCQNETFSGIPWWWYYQPYDLKLFELYGEDEYTGRESLKKLCEEADKYGIKIIMDVVANHLGVPSAEYIEQDRIEMGDEFDKYGPLVGREWVTNPEYWHEKMKSIDYNNRYKITHGSIGMPDLNTENDFVVQRTVDFLKDLKSLGVDGIRWDAAKHIGLPSEGTDYWKIVTDTGLYNYGEIITGPSDNKKDNALMAEYAEYLSVTDTKYSEWLLSMFSGSGLKELDGNWVNKGVSADKLVYWAESHDTYCNNGEVGDSRGSNQNQVDRAYAAAASRYGATALYFSRPDSNVKDEILCGRKGSEHYVSPEVRAVNHFHNEMAGKKDCFAVSNNCAVITRENGGAVIICESGCGEVEVVNAGGYAVPGTYKDEITGNEFVITENTIKGTVGNSGIAVVYNSPYRGDVYTELRDSYDILDEVEIPLHCIDVTDTHYTVTEVFRGETVSETTHDFKEGDICHLGKDRPYNTHLILTLYGTADNGRIVTERTEYRVIDENRAYSENKYQRGKISFDNTLSEWKDVYVYAYDKSGKATVENKAFPGEKMTDIGSEFFVYYLPKQFKECYDIEVVFSDGTTKLGDENNITADGKIMYKSFLMQYSDFSIGLLTDGLTSIYGDIAGGEYGDMDGEVTSADALQILRYSLELDYPDYLLKPELKSSLERWLYYITLFADVDLDEAITSTDALQVLRYSVGLSANEIIATPLVKRA